MDILQELRDMPKNQFNVKVVDSCIEEMGEQ